MLRYRFMKRLRCFLNFSRLYLLHSKLYLLTLISFQYAVEQRYIVGCILKRSFNTIFPLLQAARSHSYWLFAVNSGTIVTSLNVPGQGHLHDSFALTDLQPDSISVGYHRYPTQKSIDTVEINMVDKGTIK